MVARWRLLVDFALTLMIGACFLGLVAWLGGLGLSYAAKAIGAYAGFGLAVAAALFRDPPGTTLGAANRVTLWRTALACLFAGLVGEGARVLDGLAIPLVVGTAAFLVLDGVDGWLARRRGEESAFGRLLDHETDALFLLIRSVLVYQTENVGPWIMAAGLLHYVYLGVRAAWPRLRVDLPAARRGPAIGLGAMLGLLACLSLDLQAEVARAVAVVVLGALIWSFSIDGFRMWRKAISDHDDESLGRRVSALPPGRPRKRNTEESEF